MSVTDSFFDLGGHSLLAVRLVLRIRERFGHILPLSSLVQGATHRASGQGRPLARRRHAGLPARKAPAGGRPAAAGLRPSDRRQRARLLRAGATPRRGSARVGPPGARARRRARAPAAPRGRGRRVRGGAPRGPPGRARIASPATPSAASWRSRWPVSSTRKATRWRCWRCSTSRRPARPRRSTTRPCRTCWRGWRVRWGPRPDRSTCPPRRWRRCRTTQAVEHVLDRLVAARALPVEVGRSEARRHLSVLLGHARAAVAYAPGRYPGQALPAHRGGGRTPAASRHGEASSRVAWSSHVVPGDHESMLREPHVRALAARLRARL